MLVCSYYCPVHFQRLEAIGVNFSQADDDGVPRVGMQFHGAENSVAGPRPTSSYRSLYSGPHLFLPATLRLVAQLCGSYDDVCQSWQSLLYQPQAAMIRFTGQ